MSRRRAATAARINGEAEISVLVQSAAIVHEGRDHGDLFFGEIDGNRVLLLDGVVAPASRTVELGHQGRLILQADPIDPVFIAVESKQSAVGLIAETFNRRQN